MAYVRDNIKHSTGIDDKVVFSKSLHTWNPKYAPMVGTAGKVTIDALNFEILMNSANAEIARFAEKVNLTGIHTIKLNAKESASFAANMFVSENGSNIVKSVAIDQPTPTEYTIDVSDLTGEYYICFTAKLLYIHEVTLE